jgi:hypothetical protein
MTFGEVKLAKFEHLPVFFPDNRELWEKVSSGFFAHYFPILGQGRWLLRRLAREEVMHHDIVLVAKRVRPLGVKD